jgi:hypothetical protein
MSQQSRRRDPYPWTWELPLGIVLVILMVLVCGVHLGRGFANVLAGAGWTFPRRVELFRSLPGVLGGDAAAGLDGLNGPLSSPSAVWTWAVVTEVMLLAVGVWLLKLVVDRWDRGGCVAWRVAVRRRGCLASPVCGRSVRWSGRTCTE